MTKGVFSVFDSKASVFCNPFMSINKQTALRDFHVAALSPETTISKCPADYVLYEIGEFDDCNGHLTPIWPMNNLGSASQFNSISEV